MTLANNEIYSNIFQVKSDCATIQTTLVFTSVGKNQQMPLTKEIRLT